MALSIKPNRFYPNVPQPGMDIQSIHNSVEEIRTSLLTHERRDKNYQKSFIRFEELVDLGIITADGEPTGEGANHAAVTLAGQTYLTLSGQEITAGAIGIANLSATGTADNTTYLRGDNTWAPIAGGHDAVTLAVGSEDYLTLTGQEITVNPIDLDNLSATGTADNTTYLRGDNTWQALDGNATHTGEVTGATVLTGDVTLITNRAPVTEVSDSGTDDIALHDATDGSFKKTPVNLITDGGYF